MGEVDWADYAELCQRGVMGQCYPFLFHVFNMCAAHGVVLK